ncbi:MAG: hypothetical protein ACPG43_08740, partial [Alcanivoracaceae bacterium]
MRYSKLTSMICALAMALFVLPAQANTKATLCVFDIIGASGDIYNMMKDYKTAALQWGVDINLKV